jgi:hypothetical protein
MRTWPQPKHKTNPEAITKKRKEGNVGAPAKYNVSTAAKPITARSLTAARAPYLSTSSSNIPKYTPRSSATLRKRWLNNRSPWNLLRRISRSVLIRAIQNFITHWLYDNISKLAIL